MTVHLAEGKNPPVVLISQLGCGADIWQPLLSHLTGLPVVTYDRPGTANAPPRPAPNPALPASVMADELAALLGGQINVAGPAVIVGHSFGGLIARQFAARHSARVAGLVLLDCSIPPMHLYPETRHIIDGDGPNATEVDTVRGHAEDLDATLPAVPAIVVTRTYGRWDGINPPPHPAVEDVWQAWQRRYAAELGCPQLIAGNAGHQLQREATALVAYAIRAVHSAAGSRTPTQVAAATVKAAGGTIG